MNRTDAILRAKLNPPRLTRHTLVRPRVDALLRQARDYRVTIVHAGTGYGKSTALANLADGAMPLFWYSATEGDADPHQFLAHLIGAFRHPLENFPDTPLAILQDPYAGAGKPVVAALLNALVDLIRAPAFLVIDDYHLAASDDVNALMDHFLAFLPAELRVIVATRHAERLTWDHLVTWRARGETLEIKRDALAFTRAEIAALFHDTYALELDAREIERLAEKTEGWPIALQLVWQELRAQPGARIADIFGGERAAGEPSPSRDTLFAYLARDVLAQQSAATQTFLLETAVLRELDAAACGAVCSTSEVRALLTHLRERDLFVIALGDEHYRYHHLFHDFLRNTARRLDPDAVRARHQRAAAFFHAQENFDETMYHLLCASAFDAAATVIEQIGESVLRAGRLDTLSAWIADIPSDQVAARPRLIFLLGELARLRSQFPDALAWYAQAERAWRTANDVSGIARALRGQALIYLDTVRARQAEDLLQAALRLMDRVDDRAAQARLLELLAENKLNMGKAREAEELREQARMLREEGPSEDALSVRVKLRTGRLDEARDILETWARAERGKSHAPRAHRETMLILALIYALQGRAADARAAAEEGIAIGKQLASPFITAVALTRLGHAHQVCGDLHTAIQCYEESIALGDQLMVRRTRAEAMWGMIRAHGFVGDLRTAQRAAAEAIEETQNAGDAWLVALIQISLGASFVFADRPRDALPMLGDALAALHSCGDKVAQVAARMWLALAHWRLNQRDRAIAQLDEALPLAQTMRVDYLLTTRTLLGLPDVRVIVPLLLEARARGKHVAYITRLLAVNGLDKVMLHPGYQLRVQTFGALRVWRGETEIAAREWTRKSARQLLQVLLARRERLLEREEIFELLWAEEPPDVAARDFKVALNALNNALEPARGEAEPAFIARAESAYGWRADADVWLDVDEFAQLIVRADHAAGDVALDLYRRALALYHDDFLIAEARYADWALAERERLLALYLHAADRLAAELLARGASVECIAWCEKILARDLCWEHAYRLMMRAYEQRGDRAQARRVYAECVRVLRAELDVEPAAATREVWRQIVEGE